MTRRKRRIGPALAARLAVQEKRRQHIVNRVVRGESISVVARDEGISHQRVSQILHQQGVYIGENRSNVRARAETARFAVMAAAGASLEEIAATTARSRIGVYRVLNRRMGFRFPRPLKEWGHGTFERYTRRHCRCAECRAANTAAQKVGDRRRHEQLDHLPADRHGRRSTYKNYGCRCEPCRLAHSQEMRDYKASRARKAAA